jgi:hypothetical protein
MNHSGQLFRVVPKSGTTANTPNVTTENNNNNNSNAANARQYRPSKPNSTNNNNNNNYCNNRPAPKPSAARVVVLNDKNQEVPEEENGRNHSLDARHANDDGSSNGSDVMRRAPANSNRRNDNNNGNNFSRNGYSSSNNRNANQTNGNRNESTTSNNGNSEIVGEEKYTLQDLGAHIFQKAVGTVMPGRRMAATTHSRFNENNTHNNNNAMEQPNGGGLGSFSGCFVDIFDERCINIMSQLFVTEVVDRLHHYVKQTEAAWMQSFSSVSNNSHSAEGDQQQHAAVPAHHRVGMNTGDHSNAYNNDSDHYYKNNNNNNNNNNYNYNPRYSNNNNGNNNNDHYYNNEETRL